MHVLNETQDVIDDKSLLFLMMRPTSIIFLLGKNTIEMSFNNTSNQNKQ